MVRVKTRVWLCVGSISGSDPDPHYTLYYYLILDRDSSAQRERSYSDCCKAVYGAMKTLVIVVYNKIRDRY